MITLLIVDYKTPDKTWEYIERFVEAAHGQKFRVLIVDNSDTGDCRKYFENKKKIIKFLEKSTLNSRV